MIVFLGFHRSGREHLYFVRRSDKWIHCLTEDCHLSHYQKALVSPNTRWILVTAFDDDQSMFHHYVFDTVQESIRTLDFTVDEHRLIKWLTNRKILVADKGGYSIVDIDTGDTQSIDGSQDASTFALTSDGRYVALTTHQADGTVSLWDRTLDTKKSIDLRDRDDGCWVESVAGWTPDDQFVGVLANYSELWLIAQDGTHWYKLANLQYFHLAYRWSPDGQWLSYFHSLDHGGPGTSFGMIYLVKRDNSVQRELVTIDKGDWDWLSETEIVCISRENHDVVVDRVDALTGSRTRFLSAHEPMMNFVFRR